MKKKSLKLLNLNIIQVVTFDNYQIFGGNSSDGNAGGGGGNASGGGDPSDNCGLS